MSKKFKVVYPQGHEKAGQEFVPPDDCYIYLRGDGKFFYVDDCYMAFETYTHPLEYVLTEYDVIWMD